MGKTGSDESMVNDIGGSSKEISKYTLEAVFSAQESLRKHLEILIENNSPISDSDERDLYMREITYATLGLGVREKVRFFQQPGPGWIDFGTVESFARYLAYRKDNPVIIKVGQMGVKSQPIPIRELWAQLQSKLFSIYPLAIDRACSMSKEREERSGESEYNIND